MHSGLHEIYSVSGYTVLIHPEVDGTDKHPDFLVQRAEERFYVEAIKVGVSPDETASERRLADVHAVLHKMEAGRFSLVFTTYRVGTSPLATKRLRAALRTWLEALDPDQVIADAAESKLPGFDKLPSLDWEDEGWSLQFHALPRKPQAPTTGTHLVGAFGPGEAVIVDNVTGLLRALDVPGQDVGDSRRACLIVRRPPGAVEMSRLHHGRRSSCRTLMPV